MGDAPVPASTRTVICRRRDGCGHVERAGTRRIRVHGLDGVDCSKITGARRSAKYIRYPAFPAAKNARCRAMPVHVRVRSGWGMTHRLMPSQIWRPKMATVAYKPAQPEQHRNIPPAGHLSLDRDLLRLRTGSTLPLRPLCTLA